MKQKAFSNSLNNQNKMGKLNNSFSTEYGDYFDDIHSEFAEEMMRTKSVKQNKEKQEEEKKEREKCEHSKCESKKSKKEC